jgi:hydroxyacylglutathione hydrolase
MIHLHRFTFNAFQENTYVVWDDTLDCLIVDPGCSNATEQMDLCTFIAGHNLKPVQLINTHCHIDHILGNSFCVQKYNIPFYMHELDLPVLDSGTPTAMMYQIPYDTSPRPTAYLKEGINLKFGESELEIVFTPGHSPGSISFIAREEKFVISGDVLFRHSVGRVDLPGGDKDVLLKSIEEQLLTLPAEFLVYSGHGPETTIGHEKKYNPFLNGTYSL